MKVSFPAMRGEIGGRVYYSCLMELNTIPQMFTFRDWADITAEQREQRVLNKNRIPHIARYILENEEGYLFASITASYMGKETFKPLPGAKDMGELEFEQPKFVINDGQHRCAAIAEALKVNPALGEQSISVLLFPYENLERVQQMFSDLNRFVAKTSRSLDILYDKRDPLSRIMLEVCEKVPAFKGMVDKDAVSLPARSSKLFTLTALYDATSELKGGDGAGQEDSFHSETVAKVVDFWTTVSKAIPEWMQVKNQHLRSIELRQEKICAHSVVLRAIGGVGHQIMKESPNDWKSIILELTEIDWRKANKDWENICIVAHSVVSNRQARVATRAYIKKQLGLSLTDVEKRALPQPLPEFDLAEFED